MLFKDTNPIINYTPLTAEYSLQNGGMKAAKLLMVPLCTYLQHDCELLLVYTVEEV